MEWARFDLLRLWSRAEHQSIDEKHDVASNSDVQTMLLEVMTIERIKEILWSPSSKACGGDVERRP